MKPNALADECCIQEVNSSDQKTMCAPRIALVGLGVFSYINPALAGALRKAFCGYQLDWIDVRSMVMRHTGMSMPLLRCGHAVREFATQMGPRFWQLMWRHNWTTYLFRQRSLSAARRIAQRRYSFSIQTQSLFDASVPGLPHFVYTDNTMLANLQYQETQRSDLPVTDEWISLERQLYQNARTCFVMSHNVGRSLIEDYGCDRDKVVCAYGGHNAPIEVTPAKTYDQKNILFVGVNWERKGGPELLAAFRLLRKHMPNAKLTIVGCTPSMNEPGCEVIGRVPPSEVGRYYADASLFCMPSRREPFGIVFVEAMAHKLPIVATAVGAVPDFVTNEDNGFLVSPGDIEGLADVLRRLLSNPELCRKMGERSYAVSHRYTWNNVASIVRNTIQGLVEPQISPHPDSWPKDHLSRPNPPS